MPWIIIGVVVLIIVVLVHRHLQPLRVAAQQDRRGLLDDEFYLKKRYDLVPNLVETVKGYAKQRARL
jgi:LemA protein